MFIDRIRSLRHDIRMEVQTKVGGNDVARCEQVYSLLQEAEILIAPVELVAAKSRWVRIPAQKDGEFPTYCLDDVAVLVDRGAPPYTVTFRGGSDDDVVTATSIERAMSEAEIQVSDMLTAQQVQECIAIFLALGFTNPVSTDCETITAMYHGVPFQLCRYCDKWRCFAYVSGGQNFDYSLDDAQQAIASSLKEMKALLAMIKPQPENTNNGQ